MAKLELGPVNKQRLHESVATRIEQMILDGKLRPGESLPSEVEMTDELKVSRAVVRDAIRVLATKGLVEIRHGVGTFVTSSSRARLAEAVSLSLRRHDYTPWELFVIRRGLEMVVVEEAIAHATSEQIAQMRETLANYRRLYAGDPARSEREHIHFHQLMARATGNRVLIDLLDPITVFRIPEEPLNAGIKAAAHPADHEAYWRAHERIIDAIEQRDLPAARAAMIEHLSDLEQRAVRAADGLERITACAAPDGWEGGPEQKNEQNNRSALRDATSAGHAPRMERRS